MHNRLINRLFSLSYFFFYVRKQKVYFFNTICKYNAVNVYIYIHSK